MAKQEIIKHLTDVMGVICNAHWKSREIGVRVHESHDAAISIDLYHFEGDGKPVCDGLNPCTITCDDGSTMTGNVFCMTYDPDDVTPLVFQFEGGDNNTPDMDIDPDDMPMESLKNVVVWLEKEMIPAKQEAKPDPKQMKALMDRWAHFCYSHPPYDEVILWMIGGSKQHYLYQHFCSKFNHLCSVCHEDTMSAWIKFYRELDDQWAERLMEYVYCEWKN